MNGGYYRVDVSPKVTVLTLNTLYYDIGDTLTHGTEPQDQMAWLKSNFISARAEGRKVVINYHVYPGTRYSKEALWI